LKAAVSIHPNAPHQVTFGNAFADGLKRHGVDVEVVGYKAHWPAADFCVGWGWRKMRACQLLDNRVLLMELGYIGDRLAQCSLAWDGLNGRGKHPECQDKGERFAALSELKPWRERRNGKALLVGQVEGDMSLADVNIRAWYKSTVEALKASGYVVTFRPHPLAVERGQGNVKCGADFHSRAPLADDLAAHDLVVTYNSNTGVDAALAGVPLVVADAQGAMAAPVASCGDIETVTPDRQAWANRLAWCQWSPDEIASGFAWEVIRGGL
jgi:hypothetical protein